MHTLSIRARGSQPASRSISFAGDSGRAQTFKREANK